MNREVLSLHEPELEKYTKELSYGFNERKRELIILITNMPQKHSFVNYICEELVSQHSKESIVAMEIEALQYASKDYFLLTNALIYLERRWSTEIIRTILKDAAQNEEIVGVILSLITDPEEEEVVDENCTVEAKISLPQDTAEIIRVHRILSALRSKNIISSMRDAFTAYKLIVAYGSNVGFILYELNILVELESVSYTDIIGGVLLGIFLDRKELPYLSNILTKLLKRNKLQTELFIQLMITAYNLKDEIWEALEDIVPHFYMRLGVGRKTATALLYTLNLKNAVFLYEVLNGELPQIEIFDRCAQGRESIPDNEVRKCVRELLNIPEEDTYTVAEPLPIDDFIHFTYKPPVKYSEIEDMEYFYRYLTKRTSPSITHSNNLLLEYKDVIENLSEEELDILVRMILSHRNTLTYKEITVNKIYSIRKNRQSA